MGAYPSHMFALPPEGPAHHPHERVKPAWVDPDKAPAPMADPDRLEQWWREEALPRIRRKRR